MSVIDSPMKKLAIDKENIQPPKPAETKMEKTPEKFPVPSINMESKEAIKTVRFIDLNPFS
jgi:hypothetical protein